VIASLEPVRTLDVACGTGFLTRHLRGEVVGLDASERMLEAARAQAPAATFVRGDALSLPFEDAAFDRVFTSYFYCHLEEEERRRFLAEARRVAPELVVVASIRGEGDAAERWEERQLKDGSHWQVYKRVFEGEDLAEELGGELVFRQLVPRRARLTRRRSSYRSLASLQRDVRVCRACVEAGYPLESWAVVNDYLDQRAFMYGQAPGIVEGAERRPWRGRAGKTLRRWLELDEDGFYRTFYCASVTRCYPGRAPSGRGDRTPTPREQELCSFWREWELRLIRPR
jgi:Methylase involved in ubiquinone/menaquinone biosynthesis